MYIILIQFISGLASLHVHNWISLNQFLIRIKGPVYSVKVVKLATYRHLYMSIYFWKYMI